MPRAPSFWWPKANSRPGLRAGLMRAALAVPSFFYGSVAAGRMNQPGRQGALPVICVGNLVAGGAGKTPMALALAEHLRALGVEPAFVSLGYGAGLKDSSLQVDPAVHNAAQVGDEPLLLAASALTFIGSDRLASVEQAAGLGAQCAVFDDGFQNPTVTKNLAFLVVDRAAGVGNGMCHPGGPLRAPIGAQMPHADALVLIGERSADGSASIALVRAAARSGKPILCAKLVMQVPQHLREKPVLAYCGIGRPQKFFDGLRAEGLNIVEGVPFADHHRYSARDGERLLRQAQTLGALLATTRKDMVRLDKQGGVLADLAQISTAVHAHLVFEDEAYLRTIVRQAIGGWKASGLVISSA